MIKVIEVTFIPKLNSPRFSVLVLTNNYNKANEAAIEKLNAEGLNVDQYEYTFLTEKTIIEV